MQQLLDLVGKTLDPDTSKIIASYAFPETLTSDDVCFLTGEWININNVTYYAAENGLLDLIKWACAKKVLFTENTCAVAAREGHLEVLQWARQNECPWDEDTCSFAAEKDI
jgi:hypothetical protein